MLRWLSVAPTFFPNVHPSPAESSSRRFAERDTTRLDPHRLVLERESQLSRLGRLPRAAHTATAHSESPTTAGAQETSMPDDEHEITPRNHGEDITGRTLEASQRAPPAR